MPATGDEHPSSELEGVFGRPFTEQVAFFRRKLKNLVPTQSWDDMLREAHDDGFMVAGAAKADLLTDLATAVDKAIAEGRGIEEFRKDFRAIVTKNGWTGWTGEGSVKGEAWRVGVIYRTNSYTSYSAGRFAQLKAGNFPLWVYRHGNSKEPRPEHLSWDGLVLPPDHPFWQTHYPPSDWGCSCYALGARSEAGARRLGGKPGKKLPGDWQKIDPKTGAQVGIGKGWDYAPGATAADDVNAMAAKIGRWEYAIAKAFMDELPVARANAVAAAYRALPSTADDAARYAQRVYEPKPDLPELPPERTLGLVPSGQVTRIDAIAAAKTQGFDFSIDPVAIANIRQGGRVTVQDFSRLPRLLDRPDAIDASDELIRYRWKDVDGEEWQALFAVDPDRRTLALVSLTIGKGN
jgi:hypothetical protein